MYVRDKLNFTGEIKTSIKSLEADNWLTNGHIITPTCTKTWTILYYFIDRSFHSLKVSELPVVNVKESAKYLN